MSKDLLSRDRFVPELALFDTEAERREVFRQFWRERWGRWGFVLYGMVHSVIVIGLVGALTVFGVIVGAWLQSRGFRFPRRGSDALLQVGGLLCMLAVGFCSTWVIRRRLRRHCRERLAAKGVPICIECGYDLRGQADP